MDKDIETFESPMDNLRKNTIHNIMYFLNLHRRTMESELDSTGVFQSQHHLLMDIAKNPNSSQKELAEKMKISTATVAVSLKKLEKNGYIVRRMDESDNRLNKIDITSKGLEVIVKSREIFKRVDAEVFEGFSEEEITQIMSLVGRMIDNLKKLEG